MVRLRFFQSPWLVAKLVMVVWLYLVTSAVTVSTVTEMGVSYQSTLERRFRPSSEAKIIHGAQDPILVFWYLIKVWEPRVGPLVVNIDPLLF